MTLSVIVDIADGAWLCALPALEKLTQTAVKQAMDRAAPAEAIYAASVEIGVTFADDDFVQQLNRQYRGKDKPTNVLSFPLAQPPTREQDAPLLLGDIVLALQTVGREARESGKDMAAHTQHLVIHGVLHLLGHDHETEADAERMESLEIEILDGIKIANPYTATTDAI